MTDGLAVLLGWLELAALVGVLLWLVLRGRTRRAGGRVAPPRDDPARTDSG